MTPVHVGVSEMLRSCGCISWPSLESQNGRGRMAGLTAWDNYSGRYSAIVTTDPDRIDEGARFG